MADLISKLELALEEMVKIGNRQAINIIEKAIVQARRILDPK